MHLAGATCIFSSEILNKLDNGPVHQKVSLEPDPCKTKKLASNLQLAKGERRKLAINIRTDDSMTNGASNVVKNIKIHSTDSSPGIIWVQFDHADVGEKRRHDNEHFYDQGIESTWTTMKPVIAQFSVGRNRTAQAMRKQFPLRPAAARTIHISRSDTETKIFVNFNTRRTIPHVTNLIV